jgi:hypothetical protein
MQCLPWKLTKLLAFSVFISSQILNPKCQIVHHRLDHAFLFHHCSIHAWKQVSIVTLVLETIGITQSMDMSNAIDGHLDLIQIKAFSIGSTFVIIRQVFQNKKETTRLFQPTAAALYRYICLFVCYYASRRDAMYLRIILAQFYKFQ